MASIFLPLRSSPGSSARTSAGWFPASTAGLGLGVGSEIVALLALLAFFRRRGWF
jgi:hypothetical protein